MNAPITHQRPKLETIRFSITRLKHAGVREGAVFETDPWNNKILDYEIETLIKKAKYWLFIAWNNKILDYEIETR